MALPNYLLEGTGNEDEDAGGEKFEEEKQ